MPINSSTSLPPRKVYLLPLWLWWRAKHTRRNVGSLLRIDKKRQGGFCHFFLGTLALQVFSFHIKSQVTQRWPHRKTTQTEMPQESTTLVQSPVTCSQPRCQMYIWKSIEINLAIIWLQPHEESWARMPSLNPVNPQIHEQNSYCDKLLFQSGLFLSNR